MTTSSWRSPANELPLSANEVHVWRASLELPDTRSLEKILTEDERRRAGQFYFQKDRRHFIAARGLLRIILGHYLHLAPDQLRFCYGPYGKPALSPVPGSQALRFNLAHSYGLALYGVTLDREVGVDLEYICPQMAAGKIIEQFFSPREAAAINALPPHIRREAFFNYWTRKEAFAKATGRGLTRGLNQFNVSLDAEEMTLVDTADDPQARSQWSIKQLTAKSGYAAAIAAQGRGWRVRYGPWK